HAETPAAGLSPAAVAGRALERARTGRFDVLVVDTAGRLHVDEDLMEEIGEVAAALQPDATYLVLDSMTGQDAVESARVFAGRLPLYGVILTKLDGDARGGAALSVREITGCPIAFCGVGEQPGDLEEFQADRMASRILDLGDVVGLVEQAQEALDEEAAVADYSRVLQGKLTFEDLLGQFRMIRKMGSLKKVFGMLPGAGKMSGLLEQMDEGQMARMEAMVLSMTPIERLHPEVLDGSRRRRIARGSGNQVSDLNRLIRSLQEMQKQMKSYQRMLGGGRSKKRLIRQMTRGGRLPNLPRGFPGQSGR
ncbi:MAG: signal recognition particle protein, partial [Planctomycetota bacterium]